MTDSSQLVSVLIANYNNGTFLEEAIDSVINQTYTNWEIIIVDDASTDDSWPAIKEIAKSNSNIRIYQNNKNLKVGATKAKATSLAKGKICAILDADDALEPTAIEKHVAIYNQYPDSSLIGSNYYQCDAKLNIKGANLKVYKPNEFFSYLSSNGGIHHFWSFKKKSYDQTLGFDSFFELAEDQDLFYKLEEVGKIRVLEEPLYYYRSHQNSISQGKKVSSAYAYHIIAQLNALKRRPYRKNEINRVKDSIDNFMEWGLLKIDKSIRAKLIYRAILQFPELLLKRNGLSALYHSIL